MVIQEAGVRETSERYFFTPSARAERLLYYPTRVGHYFCDARYRFSYRSDVARQAGHHLNFMLFYVVRGRLDIAAGGAPVAACAGHVALFDCKKPHEYAAAEDTEFYWLLFNGGQSARFVEELLEMHGGRAAWDARGAAEVPCGAARLLSACGAGRRLPEHRCSAMLHEMLCQLLAAGDAQPDDWDARMDDAAAFIDAHYQTPISVPEVAARLHVSSSYFSKRFRARTGCSPHEYLVLRRIDRAKLLLAATALTVRQIAFQTGYNSEENFIHSFRKKVGISPTAFRQYPI